MQNGAESFIPILFNVLAGFVALNVIINLVLLYIRPLRINKLLALYWPAVMFSFVIQGIFQTGTLQVALAFSATLIVSLLGCVVGFESLGQNFPWKKYLMISIPFFPTAYLLNYLGYGFTVTALPICVAVALPQIHAVWTFHVTERHRSTRLQKLLGLIFFCQAIHVFNFAFFRMDPGAQLWGWMVSYVMIDILAILLPSIALEQASLSEQARLQTLVDERTIDLNKSLKTNDDLIKIILHDISNPLTIMKGHIYFIQNESRNVSEHIEKIERSYNTVEGIINQVKSIHRLKNMDRIELRPVSIEECIDEISFLFSDQLAKKRIGLKANILLDPGTQVRADKISLTYSILSNLVSNSLKFSSPGSEIEIIAREENENIILEVKDQGPGIPEQIIQDIMENKELLSTEGTMGEKGSGLGLSIVKMFVDSFGGEMKISTKHPANDNVGTSIQISLDKFSGSQSEVGL